MRVKAINKMFGKYYDFFYYETASTDRNAKVFLPSSVQHTFEFKENNKATFQGYLEFLERFVVQEMSVCSFLG